MSEREGLAEAVLLFEPDGLTVGRELHLDDFQSMVSNGSSFEELAASVAKAAYVVVGNALSVQGVAFFTFRVDEHGHADPAFNLPLRYLVDNAGTGPDLGTGRIRLACRSQCPVPWHSVNLWQPSLEGEDNTAVQVQKSIWRNRLGLKPSGRLEPNTDEFELDANHADHSDNQSVTDYLPSDEAPLLPSTNARGSAEPSAVPPSRVPPPRPLTPPQALTPSRAPTTPPTAGPARPIRTAPSNAPPPPLERRWEREQFEARLTATFGPEGKVNVEKLIRQHNEQMSRVSERYRGDLERQQQMYLDQIRNCRNEIQRLKSELRQEQDRSRRLQQLIRREP